MSQQAAFATRLPLTLAACLLLFSVAVGQGDDDVVRVFIFAGQSNMVGSDSRVRDIGRFPPFRGLEEPQSDVRFAYCIGRENKTRSKGFEALKPINGIVGPELSFAREIKRHVKAPIAIIKCAAGGTHLGGDWNPDDPQGFKMYPLALSVVKDALASLDDRKIRYRIEGFMWHQGENDMFNQGYMDSYGKNLKNYLSRWRRDLGVSDLPFFVGELCTKTIWGMDLRPRMYAISLGQKEVCGGDANAHYVPTSHVGVEIGGGVGLHYHYGTLGQLEHGVNYAEAYLKTLGVSTRQPRPLKRWPYRKGSRVKLFVLAGHRNMEGERAFIQELKETAAATLLKSDKRVGYRYSLGGGYRVSDGWEPLGPAGAYDTFGPELSFGKALKAGVPGNMAIAKFTHSGSQVIDWTPGGSVAKSRNLFPAFVSFIRESVAELEAKGHEVDLEGVFYHLGENDMSWTPFRRKAAERLAEVVAGVRRELRRPKLRWYVSQQPPTDDKAVNEVDVVAAVEAVASADPNLILIPAIDLPGREKKLVISTKGIVALGELLAAAYLKDR